MSEVTNQAVIDAINVDPAAVREALELLKKAITDINTIDQLDDADSWIVRDASEGLDRRATIAQILQQVVRSDSFRSLEHGLISNRPSASSSGADAFFLSTDEPRLYRSDGAAWEVVLSTSIDTLSDLQAADTNGARSVYMLGRTSAGDGGGGRFRWVSGDQSANVSADTEGDTWIAPDSDATGASGAWKRMSFPGKVGLNQDDNELLVSLEFGSNPDPLDQNIYGRTRFGVVADLDTPDETQALQAIMAKVPNTDSTVVYEKDALHVRVETNDIDDDGGSPDAVAIRGTGSIAGTNTSGRAWSGNDFSEIQEGGDGFLVGREINILNAATSEVKEVGSGKQKIGLKITTKETSATGAVKTGTAAIHVDKGSGLGWYKGYIARQNDFIDDIASRFIELTDLFEVMRDGRTLVGKGAANIFAQGVECDPAGRLQVTGSAEGFLDLANPTAISGADVLGQINGRGKDGGGNDTTFASIQLRSATTADGAEDGRINFDRMLGGTNSTEMSIRNGVQIGSPSGFFPGAGKLNAEEVQDDGSTLTDYVFDAWHGDAQPNSYSPQVRSAFDAFDPKWMDVDEYAGYWKSCRKLPGMPDLDDVIDGRVKLGHGEQIHRLTQTVELQAIHIDNLNRRLKELEG